MRNIRILVVDDESPFLEAIVERLQLRNFQANGVSSGEDAIALLRRESFDVVLLDVKMPSSSGLTVIKNIKNEWPDQQVVLITGHGSSQDAEKGIELGAFKYLMKPVNIDDLTEILQTASTQKGRR